MDELEEANAQVLGISCDSKYSHRAFVSHLGGISYPLLSDFWPHGETSLKFGVFQEDGATIRGTFAIDRDGVVRFVQAAPRGQERTQDDFRQALKALAAAPVEG